VVEEGASRKRSASVNVRCAATTEASNFTRLPTAEEIKLDPFAAYLHVCTNETIHGVEIPPSASPIPACRWSPTCRRTSCRGRCRSRNSA
jgi:phosphoserine aminotransferase